MADAERDERSHDATCEAAPSRRVLRFGSLAPGKLFAERYRIRRAIGSGGSGEVFEAFDEVSHASVALKVLYPGSSDRQIERVRRELELVRSISHPSVLRVWDIGEAEGLFYVVSELLAGETLKERLQREGALDAGEAERILRGLLEALDLAHARGIVHRDVKPGNVFLARGEHERERTTRVVLLDFGLARREGTSGLTSAGRFLGTPEYCAPEQVRGEPNLGPACDLYACGVTLWEMLSGAPPFEGTTDLEKLTAHVSQQLPHPGTALARSRPGLRSLTVWLLEKDPGRRPASAGEALSWLERGEGRARWALAARRMRQAGPWKKAAAAGTILALLGAVAAYGLYPVDCEAIEGRSVRWETRSGLPVERTPLSGKLTALTLGESRWGLSRPTWIAADPPASGEAPAEAEAARPFLFRLGTPFSQPRPITWANPRFLSSQRLYEDVEQPFVPSTIVDLGADHRTGEARLAVIARQDPSYPSAIILVGSGEPGWSARYLQPGHVGDVKPYRPSGGGPLQLIVTAFNNHLAHRIVLFSIPAGRVAGGQAPPFRADMSATDLFHSADWYRILPGASHPRHVDVQLDSTPPRVLITGERSFTFDPATGIPMESWARDGLGSDEWQRSHHEAWQGLRRASVLSTSGGRAKAAAATERLAAGLAGPDELVAVIWTLAAEERIQAAARGERDPRPSYEAALEDVRRASALDVQMPGVDLVEAEMLLRLGDLDGLAAVLDRRANAPRQHGDHLFSWYMIHRMAGVSRPLEKVWPAWAKPPAADAGLGHWDALLQALEAHRQRRYEQVPALIAKLRSGNVPWALHRYVEARALLDRKAPDAGSALEKLDLAEQATSEGTALPLAAARMRARALLDPEDTGAQDVARAMDCVRRFERLARTELASLVMLDFAIADAARVARAAGDADLAEDLRERIAGSCFVPGGSCRPAGG